MGRAYGYAAALFGDPVRNSLLALAVLPLAACGAAGSAEISGSAGGITWGDTEYAYFGSSYLVFSNLETDCQSISFVDNNYDDGAPPTTQDTQLLQFAFEASEVNEGVFPVAATDAEVHATIVFIKDGAMVTPDANAGNLTIDAVSAESSVEGSFDSITFEDGSLSGSFTAEWCVNLKP